MLATSCKSLRVSANKETKLGIDFFSKNHHFYPAHSMFSLAEYHAVPQITFYSLKEVGIKNKLNLERSNLILSLKLICNNVLFAVK